MSTKERAIWCMNSFVACAMNFHFSLYPEKLQIGDSLIHYRKKNPKIKKNSIDHEFTSPKQKNNFVRIMGLNRNYCDEQF